MWSGLIQVLHRGVEHPLELPFVENEQMVEACLSHTPQKALVIWHWLGGHETVF